MAQRMPGSGTAALGYNEFTDTNICTRQERRRRKSVGAASAWRWGAAGGLITWPTCVCCGCPPLLRIAGDSLPWEKQQFSIYYLMTSLMQCLPHGGHASAVGLHRRRAPQVSLFVSPNFKYFIIALVIPPQCDDTDLLSPHLAAAKCLNCHCLPEHRTNTELTIP